MGAQEWVGVVAAALRSKHRRAALDTTLDERPVQYSARRLDEDARLTLPKPAQYVTRWQLVLRVDVDGAKRIGVPHDIPGLVAMCTDQLGALDALWHPQDGLAAPLAGPRGEKLTLAFEVWRAGLPAAPWFVHKDRWLAMHLSLDNWSGMLVAQPQVAT